MEVAHWGQLLSDSPLNPFLPPDQWYLTTTSSITTSSITLLHPPTSSRYPPQIITSATTNITMSSTTSTLIYPTDEDIAHMLASVEPPPQDFETQEQFHHFLASKALTCKHRTAAVFQYQQWLEGDRFQRLPMPYVGTRLRTLIYQARAQCNPQCELHWRPANDDGKGGLSFGEAIIMMVQRFVFGRVRRTPRASLAYNV